MVATRKGRASKAGGNRDAELASNTADAGDMVTGFIAKLAAALEQRGTRAWKVKTVAKALEQAVAALPESPLKAALQRSPAETTAALLQHLQPAGEEEEAPRKRAKRAKKAAASQQPVAHPSTAAAAAAVPSVLLDDTLQAMVVEIMAGEASADLPSAAPLVCRVPAPEGVVEWAVDRQLSTGAETTISGALDAAELALKVCSALSGQAASPEGALASFAPAVALLQRAAIGATEEGSGVLQRLGDLAARTVACMHAAAGEITAAEDAALGSGAAEERKSRWWLKWGDAAPPGDQGDAAKDVASAVVRLRTAARVLGGVSHPAAVAAAGLDMKLLAPHAAAGSVHHAAETPLEELPEAEARCVLATFDAAVEQELPGTELYFERMLATRKAASMAASSLNDALAATRLTAAAAAVTPPPAALEWLRNQPPSSIVTRALDSLKAGPRGLSAYLMEVADERAVRALADATRSLGTGGRAEREGPSAADDLLFYVSTAGDADAAALQQGEWSEREDNEEGSDSEGEGGGGIALESLPDEESE